MVRKKAKPTSRGNLDIDPDVAPVASGAPEEQLHYIIVSTESSDDLSSSSIDERSMQFTGKRPIGISNSRPQAKRGKRGAPSRPNGAPHNPTAARGGAAALQVITIDSSDTDDECLPDASASASAVKQVWSFANLTFDHDDFSFLQKHFDPSKFCIAFVVVDVHSQYLPVISLDDRGYCSGISCRFAGHVTSGGFFRGVSGKSSQMQFVLNSTNDAFTSFSLHVNPVNSELSSGVVLCLSRGLLDFEHGIWSSESSRFIFPLVLNLAQLSLAPVTARKCILHVMSEYRPQQFYESDEDRSRPLPVDQILEFICRRPDEYVEPPPHLVTPRNIPGISTSLKGYQREAVAWARSIEARSASAHSIMDLIALRVECSITQSELFFDPVLCDVAAPTSDSEQFRVSGGMICDEMGLGKTLECLALVLLTRSSAKKQPVLPSVEYLAPQSQSLKPELHHRCVCGQNDVCDIEAVQCENCLYWLHVKCVGPFDPDLPYFCLSCRTHVRSPLESDCTLIISPSSICGQWRDEVAKHVDLPDFKCLMYDSSCSLDPFEMAAADVVITTYEILRKDFHHRDILSKQLRHERRFISSKTPLLGVAWKRVILDEAQMVESSTAMASEMACDLVSKFRWCVTGTPVLRGLSDIEGLMSFLRVPFFCERYYWKTRIERPINHGDHHYIEKVFRFLRSICWRTSMADAIARNELNIPPPEQHLRLHELRTIERVFYSRQHDTCMAKAREVLAVCRQRGWTELDSSMAAEAMRPLLLLRQACCHPQVGSSWLRNTSGPNKTLGMHEILAQVIKKARVEAQEGKRKIVYALNGCAGIACLLGAFDQAALLYCDAIEVAEDNSTTTQTSIPAEYSTVVVYDKLQMLHAAHNLQDVTSQTTNVLESSLEALAQLRKARTRPAQLPEFLSRAQSLAKRNEALYVQESRGRFSISESELDVLSREIPSSIESFLSWALSSLQPISLGLGEPELVSRAKAIASPSQDPGNTSLLGTFNSSHGLSLVLSNAWDKLVEVRSTCVSSVRAFSLDISTGDVNTFANCKTCRPGRRGPVCGHCLAFEVLSALLFRTQTKRTNRKESSGREAPDDLASLANARRSHFVRTDLGDAELDAGDASNRRMQLQAITDRNEGSFEQICKLLQKLFGSHDVKQITSASSQDRHHADALKFFKAFAKMKDEFVSMLQFVSKHRDYVSALDELSMSFSRMIAASPGERIDPSEEHFKMHLIEAPQRLLMLAATHSEGELEYNRSKAQLQFLQTLAPGFDSSDPSLSSTECVICRDATPLRIGILPCGHIFCSDCIRGISNGSQRLNCPLCRMTVRPTDVSHVAVPQAPLHTGPSPVNTTHPTTCVVGEADSMVSSASAGDERALGARMFSPDAIASSIASLCPASSVAIDEDSYVVEDEVIGSWSSRISGIVGRLLRIRRSFPNSKTIVFSQWNDVLDLVQECATLNGVHFLRLRSDRGVIKTFREDPAYSCLLLLLKSGANGLNLTEATHVILCEPTLAPGVHAQAIARVQRIGQTQQTHVWRNVACGTVEESVVKSCASSTSQISLQSKKSSLASEFLTLQALELLVSESASSDAIDPWWHTKVRYHRQTVSRSDALARMQTGAAALDRANGISNCMPRKSIVVHGRLVSSNLISDLLALSEV